jgi:2-polyprenyl-3-methyl-5-hydroxy-6-metoxy-1,4-benzoquinol methylase
VSITDSEDLNKFKTAYERDFDFHDENLTMLAWYAKRIVESLEGIKNLRLLSLGIGYETVPRALWGGLEGRLKSYTIVDGASELIARFNRQGMPPHVDLVLDYFETFGSDTPYDVIEMGFILEHVDDPDLILDRYRAMLAKDGRVFIAVPNAGSLHRIIGREAGLLDSIYRLSPQDLELGHKRYFDYQSFTSLVLRHGFRIVNTEGIFLKPITTAQLRRLELPASVWNALCTIAQNFPAISNGILVEAAI